MPINRSKRFSNRTVPKGQIYAQILSLKIFCRISVSMQGTWLFIRNFMIMKKCTKVSLKTKHIRAESNNLCFTAWASTYLMMWHMISNLTKSETVHKACLLKKRRREKNCENHFNDVCF